MTRRLCVLALLLCVSRPVLAQEAGQTGLAIGFPGSIGIIWHTSDAVAFRPDFTFSHSSSRNAAIEGLDTSSWTLGAGVSALFYVGTVQDHVQDVLQPALRLLAHEQRQQSDHRERGLERPRKRIPVQRILRRAVHAGAAVRRLRRGRDSVLEERFRIHVGRRLAEPVGQVHGVGCRHAGRRRPGLVFRLTGSACSTRGPEVAQERRALAFFAIDVIHLPPIAEPMLTARFVTFGPRGQRFVSIRPPLVTRVCPSPSPR